MNKGYLAGENIALTMENAINTARANATLDRQKGYHCGDLAIQAAALAELRRLDPQNALLISAVRGRIYDLGEREFRCRGWDKGSSLDVSVIDVHAQLLAEFEEARKKALTKASLDQVRTRRKGLFKRRDVYAWRDQEFASSEDAYAAQQAELTRIANASLGEAL